MTDSAGAFERLMRMRAAIAAGAVVLVLLLAMALGVSWWRERTRLSRDDARAWITAALQREQREAFLVTGSVELVASTRVTNVRRLLPGLLDLSMGTIETTVRGPGRVSYGLALGDIPFDRIDVRGDTVIMEVPRPVLYAVEPELAQLEVQTRTGWLRVREGTQLEVQQRATQLVSEALRRQAAQHLRQSEQPRINTAETLHELLRPIFASAGRESVVFRFQIGESLLYRSPD